MYVIEPKPGDILSIPTNHKVDYGNIEGLATLISFKEMGDTFYLDNESFAAHEEAPDSVTGDLSRYYNYIDKSFSDSMYNGEVRAFHKIMRQFAQGPCLPHIYNSMYQAVLTFRDTYKGYRRKIHPLFNLAPQYIVRYFEQKYISDWRPTLFRSERWLVEFAPVDKFSKPFRTYRWIPVLVRRCVKDNVKRNKGKSIGALTTYNGGKRYHVDIMNDITVLEDFISKRKRRVVTRARFQKRETFKEMVRLSKLHCESQEDLYIDNPGPCDSN